VGVPKTTGISQPSSATGASTSSSEEAFAFCGFGINTRLRINEAMPITIFQKIMQAPK
jgi:hypothetical protein